MDIRTLFLGALIIWVFGYMVTTHLYHSAELNQKDYEMEFLMMHNREVIEQVLANTLPFIPLGFEHRHPENLSSLCAQHPGLKAFPLNYTCPITVQRFGPKIEVQFISFRRVDERYRPGLPLPIELIRCTEEWAVIRAGRSNRSYILTNNAPDERENHTVDGTIFYIMGKFKHREEIPHANIITSSTLTENALENRSSSDMAQ